MSPEIAGALVGAVVGGLVAYLGGWYQQWRRDVQRRQAIATALLIELRWADTAVRDLYASPSPSQMTGGPVLFMHDTLREHLLLELRPSTVQAVMEAVGYFHEIESFRQRQREAQRANFAAGVSHLALSMADQVDRRLWPLLRLFLEAVPAAKGALEAEGGRLPPVHDDTGVLAVDGPRELAPSPFGIGPLQRGEVSPAGGTS